MPSSKHWNNRTLYHSNNKRGVRVSRMRISSTFPSLNLARSSHRAKCPVNVISWFHLKCANLKWIKLQETLWSLAAPKGPRTKVGKPCSGRISVSCVFHVYIYISFFFFLPNRTQLGLRSFSKYVYLISWIMVQWTFMFVVLGLRIGPLWLTWWKHILIWCT